MLALLAWLLLVVALLTRALEVWVFEVTTRFSVPRSLTERAHVL